MLDTRADPLAVSAEIHAAETEIAEHEQTMRRDRTWATVMPGLVFAAAWALERYEPFGARPSSWLAVGATVGIVVIAVAAGVHWQTTHRRVEYLKARIQTLRELL